MSGRLSVSAGAEPAPDGALLEDACVVVLAQLVLRSAPSQSVVPETSQPTIGDGNHQSHSCHEEKMRHSVIDYESL